MTIAGSEKHRVFASMHNRVQRIAPLLAIVLN
jgi:hypothetical protein